MVLYGQLAEAAALDLGGSSPCGDRCASSRRTGSSSASRAAAAASVGVGDLLPAKLDAARLGRLQALPWCAG